MSLDKRIEVRVSAADKAAIASAAALEEASPTEFVRRAVLVRVRVALARSDYTLMSAEEFDRLIASLEIPDEAPNLAKAFGRTGPFVQH